MSEPIQLKGIQPEKLQVDRGRIGISYSGGGPLVLIELGCARAFVHRGIVPQAIAGVSAGALAGAAHALDVVAGTGIDMAIEIVSHISMRSVKLTWPQVIARMGSRLIAGLLSLPPRLSLPPSLGDNGDLTATINAAVAKSFGLASATIGAFSDPNARPKRAKLLVAATDRIHGRSVWFPDAFPLADALVASSAIPALFPWRTMRVAGDRKVLVDGSVVINQPLSRLALHERCGTILACAVGYAGGKLPRPTNLLDNAWQSATLMSHQSSKLEEDYVRVKMGGHGVVHHIHPDVSNPPTTFDFTPDDVRRIVDQACRLTEKWLDQHRQKVEQQSRQQPMLPQVAGEPLSWLAEQWPDDLQP